MEETKRKKRRKKSGKEDLSQEEKAAEHLKSLVIRYQTDISHLNVNTVLMP